MLRRLDEIAGSLATRDDAIALIALGSAGAEYDRLDEHSDLDFAVVVADGTVSRFVDSIDWLAAAHPVAYSFANEPHGRKAMFADGTFIEYAVFTADAFQRLPWHGARIVWQRQGAPTELADPPPIPDATSLDTVEFHLNEALTNLYVGLHRELRGERLTAARFIQSYAVDRAIALLRLTQPAEHRRDPFDPSRRVEQAYSSQVLPLSAMVPGYEHNAQAARAMLGWLRERFPVHPVIAKALDDLLTRF